MEYRKCNKSAQNAVFYCRLGNSHYKKRRWGWVTIGSKRDTIKKKTKDHESVVRENVSKSNRNEYLNIATDFF